MFPSNVKISRSQWCPWAWQIRFNLIKTSSLTDIKAVLKLCPQWHDPIKIINRLNGLFPSDKNMLMFVIEQGLVFFITGFIYLYVDISYHWCCHNYKEKQYKKKYFLGFFTSEIYYISRICKNNFRIFLFLNDLKLSVTDESFFLYGTSIWSSKLWSWYVRWFIWMIIFMN